MADIIKSVVNASGTIISRVLGGVFILPQDDYIIITNGDFKIVTSDDFIIVTNG